MRGDISHRFRKGYRHPRAGRRPGNGNRHTRVLKDAILLAAEATGENGEGLNGLLGYLKLIARKEPKSFCMLLAKVLPLQITTNGGKPVKVIMQNMTPNEAAEIYAETLRGLALGPAQSSPPMIETTATEIVEAETV